MGVRRGSVLSDAAEVCLGMALVSTLFRYYMERSLRRAWYQTRGSISDEHGINRRNVLHTVRDVNVSGSCCLHLLRICHVHRSKQLLELWNSYC